MRRKFIYIGLISLILLLFVKVSISETTTGRESTKECSICHYEWIDTFMIHMRSTDIAPLPKGRLVASEKICFSCHDGSVVDSRIRVWGNDMHKVGVKPPSWMFIPKELPLNDENKIECRTCHTAHGTGDPKKQGMERSVFLRVTNQNAELCKLCHKDKVGYGNHPEKVLNNRLDIEFMFFGDKNKVTCMSCHTPHGSKYEKILVDSAYNSKICYDCHTEKGKESDLNHPVNVSLGESMIKEIENTGIKINEGKLICISCHKPHRAKGGKILAIENSNDNLCITCHNDKKKIYFTNHNMKKRPNVGGLEFEYEPNNVCSYCHKPHGWNIKGGTNGIDPYSKLCLSCHSKSSVVGNKIIDLNKYGNHPVMKLLNDNISLPLYKNSQYVLSGKKMYSSGYITCFTCHDTHTKQEKFLRMGIKDNSLCIDCHKNKRKINNTKHYSNDVTCISCHKIHNSENKNLLKSGDKGCLDCHKDNGIAKGKAIIKNNHPVNKVVFSKIKDVYKLEDGKLICTTCHEPHENGVDGKFLRGSFFSICLDCHIDKNQIISSKHDFSDKNRNFCSQCHSVHNAKSSTRILTFEINKQKDLCTKCHNDKGLAKKTTPAMLHPTTNKFKIKTSFKNSFIECVDCHDPHKNGPKKNSNRTFNNSFLRDLSTKDVACFNCHIDKKELINSKHNILKSSKDYKEQGIKKEDDDPCGFCHSIHIQKNRDLEGLKTMELCENCHKKSEIVEDKIIFESHKFVSLKNLPLEGAKSDIMNCSTCHNPHQSSKNMLIEGKNSNDICSYCHKDKINILYSFHNMKFPDLNHFVCGDCHKPHNYPKDSRYMWPKKTESQDMISEICFSCHNPKGAAKEKLIYYYTHPDLPMTYKIDKDIKPFLFNKGGKKDILGKITCSTCHDIHNWSEKSELKKVTNKNHGNALTSFLRYDKILNFCSTCHGIETLHRFKYYHTEKFRKNTNTLQPEKRKPIDFREKIIRILLGDGEISK